MPLPTLDPHVMKRLAFIRLLYQQGIDQSHLPEPLTFTSMLTFHDAVELFLVLAGEHLGASLPDHTSFMAYWAELHPRKLAGGVELSARAPMSRLNRLRNGFKHAGSLPGAPAVEQSRADVITFFEDNTPAVFGVSFEGIDMADVIPQENIMAKVKAAAATESAGDRIQAMALLGRAFQELFSSVVNPRSYRRSTYSFGPDRASYPPDERAIERTLWRPESRSWDTQRLAEQIHGMSEAVVAMQGALRAMALGIDFRRYDRFQRLTPWIIGEWEDGVEFEAPHGYAPNEEEFNYCREFVITAALRLAEVEAHTIAPSWWQADSPG